MECSKLKNPGYLEHSQLSPIDGCLTKCGESVLEACPDLFQSSIIENWLLNVFISFQCVLFDCVKLGFVIPGR